ncbi:MAG: chemotaxis response regulator protein-glutamate methylesterase [Hyphomicrobiales bacterium]|nr:chemotaxis response regulator protein-glutamate methylesterase [Hyphomicrobiales bacterium]
MVVDDSATVRGIIIRMLEADPGISVVATARTGVAAIAEMSRNKNIEVIVLDIEMPEMDGLTALPKLLQLDPSVQVIMASTLTQRNGWMSLKALEAGATDYVPKPSASRLSQSDDFRRELLEKVKTLSARRRRMKGISTQRPVPSSPRVTNAIPARTAQPAVPRVQSAGFQLRPKAVGKPDIIAIGSSTGGPQALGTLFGALSSERIAQPIIITQHMPPTFTSILAQHLQKQTGWTCFEAEDGMAIVGRQVLIAPGNRHMLVENRNGKPVVKLSDGAPENFCRPAVDPMFRSAVKMFGAKVLGVILTGMGSDGCQGAKTIVNAGGNVVAQDEASSVVWGMPGAVAQAGVCCAVVPLSQLGDVIARHATGLTS